MTVTRKCDQHQKKGGGGGCIKDKGETTVEIFRHKVVSKFMETCWK